MSFEQRLRSYLEGLAADAAPRPKLRSIDADALYRHLIDRLRVFEAIEPAARLMDAHHEWSPERVAELAEYLETVTSPMALHDAAAASGFASRVLEALSDLSLDKMSLVDRLEIMRIGEDFRRDAMVRPYARENRLIRSDATHRHHVTSLGRAFLRLRGRDAIRWLLIIELSQNAGRGDAWRVPRALLEESLADGVFDPHPVFNYAPQTLDRLIDLDVLSAWRGALDPALGPADSHIDHYTVADGMQDVVRSVLEPSAWHTAVAALQEDETAIILHGRGSGAADANRELTKLITHEVRNALVPVRHHIDALRATAHDDANANRIDKVKRGVVRVLEFIDELVTTNDLISEPITSCEISDVLREAIRWTDGGDHVAFAHNVTYRVRAPRSRLVRAVHNLLLNALQAAPSASSVRVSCRDNQGLIEIIVDDAGPGVPPELRSRVFDDGYTTRGGTGHGFGLALVRNVVETTLRGKVWCEASPLGGARFVIALAADVKP